MRILVLLVLLGLSCGTEAPEAPAAVSPAVERIAPSRGYPLTKCVVTEAELDSLDDRRALRYQGHEVQVCCETCQGRFQREPDAFMPRYLRWREDARK